MGIYSDSPEWADIVPIPQDDGGPNPLAAIAYTEDYSEAMSYLRAVMAKNEYSARVLDLTEDVIGMNAAHYTVWLYRAATLTALSSPLRTEIAWLNTVALAHPKNYQIWHHRQLIVTRLNDPTGETDFTMRMFALDAKNYHVWSYRQWLVRHFGLWESELGDVERLLGADVRNNSAWNHRWFVVFGRVDTKEGKEGEEGKELSEEVVDREVRVAKEAIRLAAQNQSPWSYLRGVLRRAGKGLGSEKGFVEGFADLRRADEVRSSFALDYLADVYAEEGGTVGRKDAGRALELLAERFDPVRRNYWEYRKSLLGSGEAEGASTSA